MDKNTFTELLDKYIRNKASEAEKKLLEEYYEQLISQDAEQLQETGDELLRKKMLDNILSSIGHPALPSIAPKNTRLFFIKIAAAAVFIFAVSFTYFKFFRAQRVGKNEVAKVTAATVDTVIRPGDNRARLTMSNGSSIVLDSVNNGTVARQGNSVITKSDGSLSYLSGKDNIAITEYNTLSTPRGGQYHLTLADGTGVWLNASSSIRFPVAFTGAERNVEITGEVYFEVAKNAAKPFHVKVDGMAIEVLGTHFNVMAYGDESAINTTLLEGAVKVTGNHKSGMLKPGEQSRFDKTSGTIQVADADVQKAVAWKNGMFIFTRDDIGTIMRQVARWYDVDINFKDEISTSRYSGSISKYVNATEVLRILELGGIKFKVDGKKISVL